MENTDTIFALASARGRAGVAVIRISGPYAFAALARLTSPVPKPRIATLRTLRFEGEVLDQALVLSFENGASFTGEDVVELHLHGGVAVVKSVLSVLDKTTGLRSAGPGEFTRRALENNQMDLPQVEGLADLIEAETEAQRRQALGVMRGALSQKCSGWRKKLIRALALLEAVIDFADEDVPVDVGPEVESLIRDVKAEFNEEISGFEAAERIRDGFEVALVGAPNIGKSTLLNALAGREVALTSEIAGTTRDVIEVRLDLNGLPVTVLDLAGIRESNDQVERLGIEKAKLRSENANLRLFLVENLEQIKSFGVEPASDDIIALGKGDINESRSFKLSGKTGLGVNKLLALLTEKLEKKVSGSSSLIRRRHREAIEKAIINLDCALFKLTSGSEFGELIAADVRFAILDLDVLLGRTDVEEILGEIFAGFCIGK